MIINTTKNNTIKIAGEGDGGIQISESPPLLTPLETWGFTLANLLFAILLLIFAAALVIVLVKYIFYR